MNRCTGNFTLDGLNIDVQLYDLTGIHDDQILIVIKRANGLTPAKVNGADPLLSDVVLSLLTFDLSHIKRCDRAILLVA